MPETARAQHVCFCCVCSCLLFIVFFVADHVTRSFADELDDLRLRIEEEKGKPYAQRIEALAFVGMVRTDEAAAVLDDVYTKDGDAAIRVAALYALGVCDSSRALLRLVGVARNPSTPGAFRAAAADALVRARQEEAFETVAALAREERSDPDVQLVVAKLLARYPLNQTEALWRSALESGVPAVRALAFRALAPLRDRAILKLARKAIDHSQESSEVKAAAVAVWRAEAGPEGTRVLIVAAIPPDPLVRAAVAEALASLTNDNEVSLLFHVLATHGQADVRAVVAQALGSVLQPGAVEALEGALRDVVLNVRLAALESLGRRREKKAEDLLQREARGTNEETALAAVDALGGHGSEKTTEFLGRLMGHSKPTLRIAAIGALSNRPAADALPILAKPLRDPSWSVRVAAVRAIGRYKTHEAVDLLVERLGLEDGRLRGDIVDVLRAMTGKRLGYEATTWKTWWGNRRDTFDFDEPAERAGGGDVNTVAYYGIPVFSKRVVFCLDISGSMGMWMEGGDSSRLDQAKKELTRILGALDTDVHANLIFFDDRIESWSGGLAPIKQNRASAVRAVEQLKPRGGTNLFDTLERALADPTVDTVFLLSDGEPTAGRVQFPYEILQRIRRINRGRLVAIHAIAIGRSEFMKELAGQNGGRYVEKP